MNPQAVLVPHAPDSVRASFAARTREVEEIIRGNWPGLPGTALAAVGGFGRAELFPQSDIDLLLVTASDDVAPLKEAWSGFLQSLWDRGLRPSHAVHTPGECAAEHEGNLELTISLLDRRFLLGDSGVFAELDRRLEAFLAKRRGAIARRLIEATESRHAKFQNTIYHLEPDLKNTPGALRDLQTVRWLGKLQPQMEVPDLTAAFETLASLRASLHEMFRRDRNILHFDAQEALSPHPAALMRTYYHHARAVERALAGAIESAPPMDTALLDRFYDWRSRLSTAEYTVRRDRVWVRHPAQLTDLGVFEFVARHQLRLAAAMVGRLAQVSIEPGWEHWKRLLSLPKPSPGLRAMQQSGILASAIPEWRLIDCLVVRDFYHRYTVDEHTLVAIASLESIADRRFADLFSEIPDPHLIRFALLLHDIGKGSGHDHVVESGRIAGEVLLRMAAPEEDRATIEFLISHHLDLSAVITSRDLHERATAKAVAERVQTIERLKQLTLFTYADISAVNPEAMTPWRLEQLWQVYLLASSELTSELDSDRIHAAPADPAVADFLEGLPVRYLRTHSPAEIQSHFELARQLASRPTAIEITHQEKIYRLTLLARDQPGLFASVAGAIAAFGLSIVKAEAFSNAHGIIVDTFTFSDPHRTLELNPSEFDRLRRTVRRVIEGKETAEHLLRSRPKSSRPARLKPSVSLNNAASDRATLIEIVAQDRPGLLYDLARTISSGGCNIEVVLIDTEAHKALDVFYVTSEGRKLEPGLAAQLRNSLLEAAV